MRVYYIFKINKYFSYVYKNKPYKLYKMLEEIFYTKEYDMIKTYKIYEQITISLKKEELNKFINNIYLTNKYYLYNKSMHIYSDHYEYSKLIVNNYNLKIKTNINNSIFLKNISNYTDNIFVIDFSNKDYFWLDKVIKSDRQSNLNLVK